MTGAGRGRLEGKVAIVTGAARGQGAAHARAFVAEGARVVVADVLVDAGRGLADELGPDARFVPLDVTDERAWQGAVAEAEDAFGPITVLVNNAGVLRFGTIAATAPDEPRRVLDVNLTGQFLPG